LAAEGKIVIRPIKGGVMLFKSSDVPRVISARDALNKVVGDKR